MSMFAPALPPTVDGCRAYQFTRQPGPYGGPGWLLDGYSFDGGGVPQAGFGAVHDVVDHLELGHPFTPEGELHAFGAMFYRAGPSHFDPIRQADILVSVIGTMSGMLSCLSWVERSTTYVYDTQARASIIAMGYQAACQWCVSPDQIVERIAKGWCTAQRVWGDQYMLNSRSQEAERSLNVMINEGQKRVEMVVSHCVGCLSLLDVRVPRCAPPLVAVEGSNS